jgi:WD40 repeat protein
MFTLKNRDSAVNSVAFSPDGGALAAAGYWGYVRLWDLASRSLRFERRPSTYNQSALFFAPGDRLYSFDGNLYDLDANTGDARPLPRTRGRQPAMLEAAPWPVPCYCAAYIGSRSLACYALADRRKLWSATFSGGPEFTREGGNLFPRLLVTAIGFAADGKTVAVGCGTGEVRVLRTDNGKAVALVRKPGGPSVKAVALSPDGTRLAVCAGSNLRLYSVAEEPQEVAHVSRGRAHFLSAAWHPSGDFFATTHGDGSADYWDARTGKRRKAFDWGLGKLTGVTFDPTGDRAACGSPTGEVIVWDVDR